MPFLKPGQAKELTDRWVHRWVEPAMWAATGIRPLAVMEEFVSRSSCSLNWEAVPWIMQGG
jgi:hypothetical protein